MKRSHQSLPAPSPLRALCVLLGLLLTVLLGTTMWYQQQYVQGAFDAPSGFDTGLEAAPRPADSDSSGVLEVFSRKDPEVIGGSGSRVVNILLVGQDSQEGEGRTRSDSMILCTFNKRTRELILTSFLRDLYVSIPGFGSDRINAAYAYGGIDLLERTLERNFDLEIDGTVEVDFSRFSQIVDCLGGVEMELRADEADLISRETGTQLTQGLQHLNGEQTLSFARIRRLDADGDFSRTSRQRRVLQALLDTYKEANLPAIVKMIRELFPMLSTDLGVRQIIAYALELFPLVSSAQVREQTIPAAGAYTDQYIDGMAVLVPDLEEARKLLSSTLLGGE